ncbi:MAG: hypothetical protein KOO61_03575 [Spirochaetales bacterium]|nr:hypothetical protein [Spirochaetales bacterium]
MRRAILALLLVVGAVAFAAPAEDFSSVIDFSISTADLVQLIQTEQYDRIDSEKLLILQGSVASTLVLDPTVETYQALVELVASRWVGLESIEVYRVYVLLEGSDFSNRVVERLPRDPGPEIILTNSELLVVAAFVGVADGADGSAIPVVTAIDLR